LLQNPKKWKKKKLECLIKGISGRIFQKDWGSKGAVLPMMMTGSSLSYCVLSRNSKRSDDDNLFGI
jgi:hypothetical protein